MGVPQIGTAWANIIHRLIWVYIFLGSPSFECDSFLPRYRQSCFIRRHLLCQLDAYTILGLWAGSDRGITRGRINDAQPVDCCIPILDLLLKRLAPPVQLSHPTTRISNAYQVFGDQFVEDIAPVFPWGMNDPNVDQMSMSVAPLPGVHPVAMSRPQVGIERLPTRRMSNEPREGT